MGYLYIFDLICGHEINTRRRMGKRERISMDLCEDHFFSYSPRVSLPA
jgi:hypothetical protein